MINCKIIWKKLLCVACVMAFLVGCIGSKVTQENYEKVQTDMTVEQVKGILGEPAQMKSVGVGTFSGAHAEWQDKELRIGIQFLNGKVKMKEMLGK